MVSCKLAPLGSRPRRNCWYRWLSKECTQMSDSRYFWLTNQWILFTLVESNIVEALQVLNIRAVIHLVGHICKQFIYASGWTCLPCNRLGRLSLCSMCFWNSWICCSASVWTLINLLSVLLRCCFTALSAIHHYSDVFALGSMAASLDEKIDSSIVFTLESFCTFFLRLWFWVLG